MIYDAEFEQLAVQLAERSKISAITISQQYGSGGNKLAAKLAFKLRWRLADYEIIAQVARQLGITEEEAALYDEHTYSFVDRFLLSMMFSTAEAMQAWASQLIMPVSPQMQKRLYHESLHQVIDTFVCTGNTVIVGRGAQVLLANQPDLLHIRVVAPFAQRVSTVMQSERLDEARARVCIQQRDRNQARYLQSQYHRNVNDPLLYDLVVNSGFLDLEGQIDLICLALEHKAHWAVV
ncbi:MAG: cytidylate kinase-like family protein [Chloroflexota bacterium]|nr:cytidylate kinase-like family protein [Chloroflexota bacterium]